MKSFFTNTLKCKISPKFPRLLKKIIIWLLWTYKTLTIQVLYKQTTANIYGSIRMEFFFHYTCLPNGLSSAPCIFTKIMKPLFSKLRSDGHLFFISTILYLLGQIMAAVYVILSQL